MTRISYISIVAAMSLCLSCAKDGSPSQDGEPHDGSAEVMVHVLPTKASQPSSDESKVESLQVFVFNSDGTLDASKRSSSSESSITLSVICGEDKDVYALVNYPTDLTGTVVSKSQMLSVTDGTIDTDKGVSPFVMAGVAEDVDITASTRSLSVAVDRLAAKITIASITNNLPSTAGDLKVTGVFLSNVVTVSKPFSAGYADGWIDRRGRNLSTRAWFFDDGLSVTVPNGGSAGLDKTFYCYGNPTTVDSTSEDWCPRHTRLVVRAEVDGQTYYYPISVNFHADGNAVVRNHRYSITSLKVNKIGSTDPEVIIEPTAVTFQASVTVWGQEDIPIELN